MKMKIKKRKVLKGDILKVKILEKLGINSNLILMKMKKLVKRIILKILKWVKIYLLMIKIIMKILIFRITILIILESII